MMSFASGLLTQREVTLTILSRLGNGQLLHVQWALTVSGQAAGGCTLLKEGDLWSPAPMTSHENNLGSLRRRLAVACLGGSAGTPG